QSPVGAAGHGLVAEWRRGAWHRIAALTATSGLRAITRAPETSRLWAVGWKAAHGTSVPLVEHRGDSGWAPVPVPVTGPGILEGVAAMRGETFAVGEKERTSTATALAVRHTS